MRRESSGGGVVRSSLSAVGVTSWPANISLVETSTAVRPLDAVLVQSAWNVLPQDLFWKLLAPYPAKMRGMALARRSLAQVQMRRAGKVVTLTHAMGDLVEASLGRAPHVAPATAPLYDWTEPTVNSRTAKPSFAVVVGTVTWFKRPHDALDIVKRHFPEITEVKFVGHDDGSGCWMSLQAAGRAAGLEVTRCSVAHHEIYNLYKRSRVCILPSALESLGFALAEALLHGQCVVASSIPPHLEVAARVGRQPRWILNKDLDLEPGSQQPPASLEANQVRAEWCKVSSVLGLG